MFRKLISNLPFSPSLINQLGFYSVRLKKERFTRKIGLVFTVLAIITQSMTFIAPSKATLAASLNDIIYGGANKEQTIATYKRGCDSKNRCDIRAIFNAYGINESNLASARYENIFSSTANNYWSIGRAPRGYGGDIPHRVGGTTIYSRTLHGWALNRYWQALRVETAQGTKWILTDCGNVVTKEGIPEKPKYPDVAVTKKVDNTAPLKGQNIKYTVTVTNNGPAIANSVGVSDNAPNGITFKSVSGAGNPTISGGKLMKTTQPFPLGVGQKATYLIVASLDVDGPARIDNIACAITANDTNPHNNCGSATILVRPICPLPGKSNLPADDKNCTSPGIKIQKTADKKQVRVGDTFNYTLKATNTGDTDLPNAVIKDVAPNEIEFLEVKDVNSNKFVAAPNKREYVSKVFPLNKGASVTITLKVKAIKSTTDPAKNQACILSTGVGTTAGACDDETTIITEVCPTNPKLDKSSPDCVGCPVPGKQNLPKNSPECRPCDETKQNEDGKDISCLELHKKARNITQQIQDANNTRANAGDTIEYTLSVKNLSKQDRKGFIIEENLEDVLEYGEILDASGATFTDKPVRMLSWKPVDIKPNETVTRTILIKIKTSGFSTPSASSDPTSYDMKLTNVYGDTVNIELPPNPVKTVEQTVTNLPSTGLGTNILISTILLSGAVYFYYRSRLMVKEVGLVRHQFNYGMGV